jgi:hypothetical protein
MTENLKSPPVGNLAAGVNAENSVFAPITMIMALGAFKLAIEK